MSRTDSSGQDGLRECPTCGPTAIEPHPRREGVSRCANCKEWLEHPAPMTPTQHPEPAEVVGLTEGEREAVCICPWTSATTSPGDAHETRCSQHRVAVERILADRLAAVQAERDAAHAKFVESWDRALDTEAERDTARREADDLRARLGAAPLTIFDIVTKAVSPDDWARHLPGCGFTDDGPDCGCAKWGRDLLREIRAALANPSAAGEGK